MAVSFVAVGDTKLPTLFGQEQGCSQKTGPTEMQMAKSGIAYESDSLGFSTCTNMPYCRCQEIISTAQVLSKDSTENYKSPEECSRWAAFSDAEALRRAEWDLWAKLRSLDSQTAESVFGNLADKYQPRWRAMTNNFNTCTGMPYCQCWKEATQPEFSHCTQIPYCRCQEKMSMAKSALDSQDKSNSYKTPEERSRWASFADAEGLRRAEWDLWAKLQSQDSEGAVSVFSNLADKHQPGWRRASSTFKKCFAMPYCQCKGEAALLGFSHCSHMPYGQCHEHASVATSLFQENSTSYRTPEERNCWVAFADEEGLRRAEWDLWAKIRCQDVEGAESVFVKLAATHQPEWRSATGCIERCYGMPYCQCKPV